MTSRPALPPRAALAIVLGLLAVLPCSSAIAGGPKPANPPGKGGKPTPPAAAPAPIPASFGDLESSWDAKEKEAQRSLRRQRYEAVVSYWKANAAAKDAEEALLSAVSLAEEVEAWPQVVEHADAYAKGYAEGKSRVDVLGSKAGALDHLDRNDDAKQVYKDLTQGLAVGKQAPQSILQAWVAYADFLANLGDVEGAKAAYQSCKDVLASVQGAAEVIEPMVSLLDSIGQEPTALPETAKDLEGKPVSLAEFKGKVLLIDFWASWCPPCRAEMPNVIETYRKYHDQGFEILGISLDHKNEAAKVREFITAKHMPWKQVYYPSGDNEVATAYGVEGIPHTILVGRDGKIFRVSLHGDALPKAVAKALQAKAK